jgi:hypothetical protein
MLRLAEYSMWEMRTFVRAAHQLHSFPCRFKLML